MITKKILFEYICTDNDIFVTYVTTYLYAYKNYIQKTFYTNYNRLENIYLEFKTAYYQKISFGLCGKISYPHHNYLSIIGGILLTKTEVTKINFKLFILLLAMVKRL